MFLKGPQVARPVLIRSHVRKISHRSRGEEHEGEGGRGA